MLAAAAEIDGAGRVGGRAARREVREEVVVPRALVAVPPFCVPLPATPPLPPPPRALPVVEAAPVAPVVAVAALEREEMGEAPTRDRFEVAAATPAVEDTDELELRVLLVVVVVEGARGCSVFDEVDDEIEGCLAIGTGVVTPLLLTAPLAVVEEVAVDVGGARARVDADARCTRGVVVAGAVTAEAREDAESPPLFVGPAAIFAALPGLLTNPRILPPLAPRNEADPLLPLAAPRTLVVVAAAAVLEVVPSFFSK